MGAARIATRSLGRAVETVEHAGVAYASLRDCPTNNLEPQKRQKTLNQRSNRQPVVSTHWLVWPAEWTQAALVAAGFDGSVFAIALISAGVGRLRRWSAFTRRRAAITCTEVYSFVAMTPWCHERSAVARVHLCGKAIDERRRGLNALPHAAGHRLSRGKSPSGISRMYDMISDDQRCSANYPVAR